MPGLLTKIGSILGSDAIGKVADVVDRFVQTKDEKAAMKRELEQMLLDHEMSLESEISARHKADMESDSWLSKNIRPMLTIFSLALYTIFSLTDGNVGDFNINDNYVNMLSQIVIMSLGFYFTSRGIEKTAKIITENKAKKK